MKFLIYLKAELGDIKGSESEYKPGGSWDLPPPATLPRPFQRKKFIRFRRHEPAAITPCISTSDGGCSTACSSIKLIRVVIVSVTAYGINTCGRTASTSRQMGDTSNQDVLRRIELDHFCRLSIPGNPPLIINHSSYNGNVSEIIILSLTLLSMARLVKDASEHPCLFRCRCVARSS